MSVGVTFVRDEDGVTLDRVLLRNTKLGADSPALVAHSPQWAAFVPAAIGWDRKQTVWVMGLRLMHTEMIGADEPVCITDMMCRHLHVGWDEWREFVDEIRPKP